MSYNKLNMYNSVTPLNVESINFGGQVPCLKETWMDRGDMVNSAGSRRVGGKRGWQRAWEL